ncbi:hypothetical protein NDI43_24840 [Microcoleus vaginatus GB2-A3]
MSNYAQNLLGLWVQNSDWRDRGIMPSAIFRLTHSQIANFLLLEKQFF